MKKTVWILAVLALASFALAQQKAEDVIKAQCAKAQVVAELWHGFRQQDARGRRLRPPHQPGRLP